MYLGGKSRLAKRIAPILSVMRGERVYVEPFIGGANMFVAMPGPKIGNDINPYLIALLRAVRDGWIPPDSVSEDEYARVRKDTSDPALHGFVGFGCSFGAKWWGGYARSGTRNYNYAAATRRTLIAQRPSLIGSRLECGDYAELELPDEALIYCDPPYRGTTQYRDAFDSDRFWAVARRWAQGGHVVVVSEYSAPEDVRELASWEVGSHVSLNKNVPRRTERLFLVPAK